MQHQLVTAMISAICCTAWCAEDAPRVITLDTAKTAGAHSTMWQQCVGAGRVGEGLKPEWQRQLTTVSKEIGFKQLRCHGLYHDELSVYKLDAAGKPVYDFSKIDVVYDYLLSVGIRPFVEFGPSPEALSSNPRTTFWWKAHFSVPKDLDRWAELVTATTRHWVERYGLNEVLTWNFEVWNEPDHHSFLIPRIEGNSQQEYCELYARTAKAVKAVDPRLRVGGPAGSSTKFIKPLMEYCTANQVPLDFITSHTYGCKSFNSKTEAGLDEFGNNQQTYGDNLQHVAKTVTGIRATIDASPYKGLPYHMTEWGTSWSPRDPSHDAYQAAPFILEQLKHAGDAAQSMSYWVFTDIFEEAGPLTMAFQGCFGLMTTDGIRKPAYFAYSFLNRLGSTELVNADTRSWACSDGKGGVQVLLWDFRKPIVSDKPISNQRYFTEDHPAKDLPPVTVTVASLAAGSYTVTTTRVGHRANDAYTPYLVDMKRPKTLTPEQLAALQAKADGAPEKTSTLTVAADGALSTSLPMREFDCVLLTIAPTTH